MVGYAISEPYSADYDKHSEGGWVGGSAGNSGAGYRDVGSFFGELLLPVMDDLEVTASFRQDEYSMLENQHHSSLALYMLQTSYLVRQ